MKVEVDKRYIRRNGTITPPLKWTTQFNMVYKTTFVFDIETMMLYDTQDHETGHLVNTGKRWSDGDLKTNGFDLMEEYHEPED